jgi:hypothetical protein
MRKNIQFFGSPTLLSSRPKTDLIEAGGDSVVQRPSIAANSGFTSQAALSRSTFKSDPVSRGVDGQIRVPRIIANLEPTTELVTLFQMQSQEIKIHFPANIEKKFVLLLVV